MKKHNRLFIITTLCLCFFACSKESLTENDTQVGRSSITYYATVTLEGQQYMSVVRGRPFTDPGATAVAGGSSINVTTSGSVNTAEAGIYTITYTAVNKDSFPASAVRYVAVLPSEEMAGVDLSGTYNYVATGANPSVVTKVAPGFYTTTNVWSNATTIPAMFLSVDGNSLILPTQGSPFGTLSGTGTYSAGALTYTISIPSQGISNSVRRWRRA